MVNKYALDNVAGKGDLFYVGFKEPLQDSVGKLYAQGVIVKGDDATAAIRKIPAGRGASYHFAVGKDSSAYFRVDQAELETPVPLKDALPVGLAIIVREKPRDNLLLHGRDIASLL